MPNVSKESVNYRYPKECCGYCKGAYVSTYGDIQCSCLVSGNTIDLGGVCDLFVRDGQTDQADDNTATVEIPV